MNFNIFWVREQKETPPSLHECSLYIVYVVMRLVIKKQPNIIRSDRRSF